MTGDRSRSPGALADEQSAMLAGPLHQTSPTSVVDASGRELLFFGGCNYLGLGQHPAVLEAVRSHLASHGLSAGASRTTTGNSPLHTRLEAELADFLRLPAVALLPDGYTANIAAAQALASSGVADAHLDARAHPSLRDAARAACVRTIRLPHRQVLDQAINTTAAGPVAVWTDGIFTADGSVAPITEHLQALPNDGVLLVDDCHGFAAIGPGGRGTTAEFVHDPRLVVTTTLAKGLGAAGGIVAGQASLIERVRATSAFVCTTPIAPALAAGSLAALSVLRAEPDRVERARTNALRARAALRRAGLNVPDEPAPIIGLAPFEASRLRAVRDHLLEAGILAPLIEYPGSDKPLYFRITLSSEHSPAQIDQLGQAMAHAVEATAAITT